MQELSFQSRKKYTLITSKEVSVYKPLLKRLNIKWNSQLQGWLIEKGTEEFIKGEIKKLISELDKEDINETTEEEEIKEVVPPEIKRVRNRQKDRKIQHRYRRSRSPGIESSSDSDEETHGVKYIPHAMSKTMDRNDKLENISSDSEESDSDIDKRSNEREIFLSSKTSVNMDNLHDRLAQL